MMRRHAAVTIISKNYFAYAKTLAESYRRHHPEHDFLIVLVDKADGHVPQELPCGAEVIELGDLALPDVGRFIYRYSIMELNTAVKPFALADLFRRRDYETLLYIDPDILVFRPLAEVHAALEAASIVLTPHIRRPYHDEAMPGDLTILQSGTYNLGFLGLRNTASARAMLEWWMGKLYRDCVVDIPNGLFVDQKWIDLVPGMFPDHRILYGAGYNAAYWNLHERELARDAGGWTLDGEPLAFFHFSGYIPFAPQTLSKHQNRHRLEHMPDLKALTEHYREALLANGYEESSAWPYAFETLSNGVRLPLDLVRNVMQWASRKGVPVPCPIEDPEGFCRFLMSRSVLPGEPGCVLLFHFLLQLRGDVLSACPKALHDHDDECFRAWLRQSGGKDYRLEGLLPYEDREAIDDLVEDSFRKLRRANRQDIFDKFPDLWRDASQFEAFASWVATHGTKQLRLSRGHAQALRAALPGLARILNVYFLRGDLQIHFPHLADAAQVAAFAKWLGNQRYELELSAAEISLFTEFALAEADMVEKMRFLYGHKGVAPRTTPNIYAIDARRYEIGSVIGTEKILAYLQGESAISPADQYLSQENVDPAAAPDFEGCSVPGLDPARNHAYVKRAFEGLHARRAGSRTVNLAGYLGAVSGMGESGRSMRSTLEKAGVALSAMSLPHPKARGTGAPASAEIFGWPTSRADVSVTVANADAIGVVECFLPKSYWAARNVGYWVWETQALPRRFVRSERRFDEIWTPSRHSAQAIARTVSVPVRVLPHTLEFAAIHRARPDRRRFGLPEGATLFGFIFDPNSVIERKNVAGLVEAFELAFRKDDNCHLVLKVNGRTQGAYDYEMIRARSDPERILWLDADLTREETFSFMKSLDAYVSLHRAEGFGLTCAEAMALGLPVVASHYSGNLDFMNIENSVLVPTPVIETNRPHGPYPAGTRWGDPDLAAAAQLMRSLLARDRRQAIGEIARQSIAESLDPGKVGAMAAALIAQLVAKAGERGAAGSEAR